MNNQSRAEQQYIVQCLGISSVKFGGLERFMISLSKVLKPHNINLILVLNSPPQSKEFLKQIRDNQIEIFYCDIKHPFALLRTMLKIKRIYKPILYHSHFQPIFPTLFAKLLGYKEIWVSLRTMIHSPSNEEIYELSQVSLKTWLIRKIINFSATRIFAVSNSVNEQYTKLFPEIADKIETFYMGAETNLYDREKSRSKFGFSEGTLYICTVAFDSPMKGLDLIIDSAKILNGYKKMNNVKFCLIGIEEESEFAKKLKSKSIEYKIGDSIIFLGITDNVPELLKAMDIYLQPSRTEAISMTLMEAAMAGLPLVGSNVGGIPEIVINGETGFLFEAGNTIQLAEKLLQLIENPELRKSLGEQALNRANNNFNRDTQILRRKEFYLSLYK